MTEVFDMGELRLENGQFIVTAQDGDQRREATEADFDRFRDWATRYDKALDVSDEASQQLVPGKLLDIGREARAWLDGKDLLRLLVPAFGPIDLTIAVPDQPDADE